MVTEQIRNRVLALLRQDHITKALIASTAGVHRNTLNGIEQASWTARGSTLDALAAAADKLERLKP